MANQKAFIGKDSIAEMQYFIHSFSPKKVFLLRGKRSYETCGAKDILEELFLSEDIAVSEWYDFQENPKIEDVEKGLTLFRESNADMIIAVGGGSVLDMAKLIRFVHSYEGELTKKDFVKTKELIPLIAIPTTSGTGCETTPFAVCYKDKVKYSVAHHDMQPDFAIVYPPLTYCNSPYLTACTGFDALAQAIEAYWNVNATAESDRYAKDAINLLWSNLPQAVNNPNPNVRDNMSIGAFLAGKAISITKTTAPHAFSYAFTTYCGYPHGHAVALTFPFFFELNALKYKNALQNTMSEGCYSSKIKELKCLLKLQDCNLLTVLHGYLRTIGLSKKIDRKYNVNFLLSQVNIERLANNPVKLHNNTILELEKYLYGY